MTAAELLSKGFLPKTLVGVGYTDSELREAGLGEQIIAAAIMPANQPGSDGGDGGRSTGTGDAAADPTPATDPSSSGGAAAGIVIGVLVFIITSVVGVLYWRRNENLCSQTGAAAAATAQRNERDRREAVRNTMEMEVNPLRKQQQQQQQQPQQQHCLSCENATGAQQPEAQPYGDPGGNQMLYSANSSAASPYSTPSGRTVTYAVPMAVGADDAVGQANEVYYSQISELPPRPPEAKEDCNGYVDDGWVHRASGSTGVIYAIPAEEDGSGGADTYETVA